MRPNEKLLSLEWVRAKYHYDPDEGVFRFKQAGSVQRIRDVGRIAGSTQTMRDGYLKKIIEINDKPYVQARLAWFYVTGHWPENEIDHKDCDSTNNRFENLREATKLQNGQNQRTPKTNSSGWKGVCFHKRVGKWGANISVNNRRIALGYYDDVKEAAEAYMFAALEYHGEFARLE